MPRTGKHQWKIIWEAKVPKQIDKLPDEKLRQAVFDSLAELCQMENPLRYNGISSVRKFPGIWRIHVEYREHIYRVLFRLEPGKLVIQDIEYKGHLRVFHVGPKKDDPYR